jgi:hypothetical protein
MKINLRFLFKKIHQKLIDLFHLKNCFIRTLNYFLYSINFHHLFIIMIFFPLNLNFKFNIFRLKVLIKFNLIKYF